jgi:hypothetical protein
LNARQKYVLWIGIAVIGIMCLFPPQIMLPQQFGDAEILKAQISGTGFPTQLLPYTRYSFVFVPTHGSVGIDWGRFLLPLFFVIVVTVGATVTLYTKEFDPQAHKPAV